MELNSVTISGNLTRDPELRSTQSGVAVLGLSIGHNRNVKRAGEWKSEANYFDITVWGKAAEWCAENLSKGDPVVCQGELTWEQWERSDGSGKNSRVLITARVVKLMKKRDELPSQGASPPPKPKQEEPKEETEPAPLDLGSDDDDDDVPF